VIAFEILTGVNYNMVRPGTRLTEYRTDVEKEVNNLISEMLQEEPRKRPWDGGELLVRLQKLDHARKVEKDRQAEQKRREEEQRQERERREREEDELRKEQAVRQKQEEEARRSWLEKEEKEPAKQPENRTEVNNKAEQSSPYLPKSEPKWKAIFSDKRRNYFMVGVMIVGIIWILVANNPPKTGISTPITAIGQETTQSSNRASQIQSTNTPANTATARPTATKTITKISEKDGMEMVYVPSGSFTMGSQPHVVGPNEEPPHVVYLDDYWIDKYEVTNAQYRMCEQAGVCDAPSEVSSYTRGLIYGSSEYDDYPVTFVNWYQANKYCSWAGRHLPSEAEWEKAARGTDGRLYPWGNENPNRALLNFRGDVDFTTQVGSYPAGASPYGAFDMAGNVWEWVNDWYKWDYYISSPSKNPPGPATGDDKVLRGGFWGDNSGWVSSVSRQRCNPENSFCYYGFHGILGFRCASSD
jgi:serine/threonine-protein kinase